MTPAEIANKWQMNRYRTPGQIGGMDNKEYFDQLTRDIQVACIEARIQERKTHIYVLESDLLDNGPEGENIYPKDYCGCITDEISNHQAYIKDLENELDGLK